MPPRHEHLQAGPEASAAETAAPPAAAPRQAVALDWMQDCLEWGVKAPQEAHGLTLGAINIGIYGAIPEEWDEMTRMPRGAYPVEGVPRLDNYSITKKVELWADQVPELYEEAVQRRWIPATDIPWDSITPLSEDVELAMGQFCTELCQHAVLEGEVIGNWLHRMVYGYYEVKSFLATEAFDASRHYAAFRQRALTHGGVLGLESPGMVHRRVLEVRGGWTEAALFLYIMRGTLTLLLYRYGEAYAHNAAEKRLFRLALQDKARHLAYGMAHLKYAIERKGRGYARSLQHLLVGAEQDLAKEMQDPVLWEALAIIFGNGVEHIGTGMTVVRRLQQDYLTQYIQRLQWVGVPQSTAQLAAGLQGYVPAS